MPIQIKSKFQWPETIRLSNHVSEACQLATISMRLCQLATINIIKLLKIPIRSLPRYSFLNPLTLAVEDFER